MKPRLGISDEEWLAGAQARNRPIGSPAPPWALPRPFPGVSSSGIDTASTAGAPTMPPFMGRTSSGVTDDPLLNQARGQALVTNPRYGWSSDEANKWVDLALSQGALPQNRLEELDRKPLYRHEKDRLLKQAYAMYRNAQSRGYTHTTPTAEGVRTMFQTPQQVMRSGKAFDARGRLSPVPVYEAGGPLAFVSGGGAQNPVKGAMDEYTGQRQQKSLINIADFIVRKGGGQAAMADPMYSKLRELYVTEGGKWTQEMEMSYQGLAAQTEQLRLGAEAERPLTPNTPEYGLIASSAQRLVQIAQATGQIGLLEGIPNPAAVRVKDVPMVMREIEERIKAAGTLEEMRRGRGEEAREEERHGVQMPYYRLGVKEKKAELEERSLKRRQMEASAKYTEALTRRIRQGGGGGTGKLAVPREAERKLAATARGELEDLMEGVESGGWGGAKAPFDITNPEHERLLKRVVRMGFKAGSDTDELGKRKPGDRENWLATIDSLKRANTPSDEILEYLRDRLLDIENMVNEEEELARGAKAGLLRSKNTGGKRRPASVSGE